MDDLEASSKPVLEVASWLNWWVVADCDLTNSTKPNSVARVRCLFIIGDSQWNSWPKPQGSCEWTTSSSTGVQCSLGLPRTCLKKTTLAELRNNPIILDPEAVLFTGLSYQGPQTCMRWPSRMQFHLIGPKHQLPSLGSFRVPLFHTAWGNPFVCKKLAEMVSKPSTPVRSPMSSLEDGHNPLRNGHWHKCWWVRPPCGRCSRAALDKVEGHWGRTEDRLHALLWPLHTISLSPPVTWEPIEFPSYSLVPLKTQALQGEVDNLLLKDALEIILTGSLDSTASCFWWRKHPAGRDPS